MIGTLGFNIFGAWSAARTGYIAHFWLYIGVSLIGAQFCGDTRIKYVCIYIYMLFKRDIWICQSREGPNVLSNWKRSAIFICLHFPRVVPINVKMFYPSFTNIYSEVLLLMLQSSDMTRVSLLALSFYIFRKQVQYLRERTGQTFMATKYH